MNSDQIRQQLDRKRGKRVEAEKKAGEQRRIETRRSDEAARARRSAEKSSSDTTIRSKLRTAQRKEEDARKAAAKAADWQAKSAALMKEEARLSSRLADAEKAERTKAERDREREAQRRRRQAAAEMDAVSERLEETETAVRDVLRTLREPKPEKLRILMLGADSQGGLRIAREQKRIKDGVRAALHRDSIEIDARGAATPADLLDGLTGFRPHVVHFSGHSHASIIAFEQDTDLDADDHIVSAEAFLRAVEAPDEPPLLVFLNSCHSAAQLLQLVEGEVPFAIGMTDEVGDGDAITYAAAFYTAVANGQSILASHRSGRAALQLAGLTGTDLPRLEHAQDVDPSTTVLVEPPRG